MLLHRVFTYEKQGKKLSRREILQIHPVGMISTLKPGSKTDIEQYMAPFP